MSFQIRQSVSSPEGGALDPFIEPPAEDVIQHTEIRLQRDEWAAFFRETPKEVLDDPSVWQYWRGENRPKGSSLKSQVEKFFAKRMGLGSKILQAQVRLKVLIRNGVPPPIRGDVWWRCSGGAQMQAEASASQAYSVLVSKIPELDPHVVNEVDKDLPRTMPELSLEESPVLESLRKILLAYAIRNPVLGYCQSLNFLGCLLLLHMASEERAFWAFCSLLEQIMPKDYYSTNMIGGRVDQAVLQACLNHRLPDLYKHLEKLECALDPIVLPWFLCCFINALPLYTVCRVWDSLFWEGDMILFKTGISMVRIKEADLLDCGDFMSVYCTLKSAPRGANHTFPLDDSLAACSTPARTSVGGKTHQPTPSSRFSFSSQSAAPVSLDDAPRSTTSALLDSTFSMSLPRKDVKQLRDKFEKVVIEASRQRHTALDELRRKESESESSSSSPSSRQLGEGSLSGGESSTSNSTSTSNSNSSSKESSSKTTTPRAAPVRGNSVHRVRGYSESDDTLSEKTKAAAAEMAEAEAGSSPASFPSELSSSSSSSSSGTAGSAVSTPTTSSLLSPSVLPRAVRRMSNAELAVEAMRINMSPSGPGSGSPGCSPGAQRERLAEVAAEMRTRERHLSMSLNSAVQEASASVFLFSKGGDGEDDE